MKRVTVSSRALGPLLRVDCYVYETSENLRAAGQRWNGARLEGDTLGVCQAVTDDAGRTVSVLIRLARGHLSTHVVSHEMHHAATALYGAHCGDDPSLTHHNEPFAYPYSDLLGDLVDRLYALGYYS